MLPRGHVIEPGPIIMHKGCVGAPGSQPSQEFNSLPFHNLG